MRVITKDEKGQAIVEFVLCLPIILMFLFGITTFSLWWTAGILAQSISQEAARECAQSTALSKAEAEAKATKIANSYINSWGHYLIDTSKTTVDININATANISTCKITVTPKITRLFLFELKTISRESNSTLERVWREPYKYLK